MSSARQAIESPIAPRAAADDPPALRAPDARAKVGMVAFLVSECFFFGTLFVAYITFMGRDASGPTPAEVLKLPIPLAGTFCLLLSSFTIARAAAAAGRGERASFRAWILATILLGYLFLMGTAYEWFHLLRHEGLTIDRNLFGTTYYTLVGFHAFHVTIGVLLMIAALDLLAGSPRPRIKPIGIELLSWYWHFVDAVWIVVFTVVYLWSTGVL